MHLIVLGGMQVTFEFVNGAPTTAGTYQVRLSSAGLKKLQEFANGATGSKL